MMPTTAQLSQYGDLRIAWLMPGWGFSRPDGGRYWKIILREFIRIFPQTIIVSTGEVHPYYQRTLNVHSIGNLHIVNISRSQEGYASGFTWITPKLLMYLLRQNFDIIITTEYTVATLYAAIARCFKRTRIVLLKEGRFPIETRSKRWYRICVSSRIDRFLANTTSAQEYLQQSLGVPREKILCRPYLVPPELITSSPAVSLPSSPHPIFLFIGQLIPRKGVFHLLEAANILKRQGKDFSIWIVGDGPQREAVKQKIQDLNLAEIVWLFGKVPYEQMGIFYHASDIFVLPSLSDYRSVAVMEAAKCGKPILDSKYDGGASEFVRDGENGFIFDPRNLNEFVSLMIQFMNSPHLIEKFGRKSQEIMKPYTLTNAVAALREAIEYLSKRKKGSLLE